MDLCFQLCWVFIYVGRTGHATSYCNSMFNILRKCEAVFQSGCSILQSHQKYMSVPVPPHSNQYLVLSVLFKPSWCVGNGTPLQNSWLDNPTDGGAWKAAVHGVAESRTQLSGFTFTFPFHALEKEMATHSSVLAWRIPGTGEPGGLPSTGSHRVGHDWSDLAAVCVKWC